MEESEKKTPVFNYDVGEFEVDTQGNVVTATGDKALLEIIIKAEGTERGIYLIYADTEDPELDHKYGTDSIDVLLRKNLTEATRISEVKRAIKDAIIYDPWIEDVNDIAIQKLALGGYLSSFTINTIFDTKINVEGVAINGY